MRPLISGYQILRVLAGCALAGGCATVSDKRDRTPPTDPQATPPDPARLKDITRAGEPTPPAVRASAPRHWEGTTTIAGTNTYDVKKINANTWQETENPAERYFLPESTRFGIMVEGEKSVELALKILRPSEEERIWGCGQFNTELLYAPYQVQISPSEVLGETVVLIDLDIVRKDEDPTTMNNWVEKLKARVSSANQGGGASARMIKMQLAGAFIPSQNASAVFVQAMMEMGDLRGFQVRYLQYDEPSSNSVNAGIRITAESAQEAQEIWARWEQAVRKVTRPKEQKGYGGVVTVGPLAHP